MTSVHLRARQSWVSVQTGESMKTVVITGAYRGLGYVVARQLSERDWKVMVSTRRRDQGSAAAAKLKNASFLELAKGQGHRGQFGLSGVMPH
jgi:NAD(P)-dependent dehydrogenase (short-subunit alcohol dehydrogenase family)